MKWQIKKIPDYKEFSTKPKLGDKVWVETKDGVFMAQYCLWDFTVPTSGHFEFRGNDFDVIAWMPYTNDQPERSKREDSQVCEMRCSEHCGNTMRDK
jgi:hypothetical protein